MKSFFGLIYLECLICCFSLTITLNSLADVGLPWSTTFDCAAWTQPNSLDCDGIDFYGNWTNGVCPSEVTRIISEANNASGDGGRGARFSAGQGVNQNSGTLKISFNSTQSEIWIRWYMRYEAGMYWSSLGYDKILYFNAGTNRSVIPEFYGSDKLNVWTVAGSNNVSYDGEGWNTINGGSASDGKWHCYEIHMKVDTNGSNGIAQWWIDETLRLNRSDIDYGTHSGWNYFHFYSNQSSVGNSGCVDIDFDDFAINNTGYIGPIGGGGSGSSPAVPGNVEIQ